MGLYLVGLIVILLLQGMQEKNDSKAIKVYIRLHNGNGCPVHVSSSCSFNQLINIINICNLQLPQTYTVLVKGKHVKDYSATLQQLGIEDNSILHIEETPSSQLRTVSMDVYVSFSGQFFVVKVTGSDLVAKLKQGIYKLAKIRPKDQILVFNGKKLSSNETLNHYKICPSSLICLLSTSQPLEHSQILSDYDNIATNFIPKESQLLQSVVSLCQKRTSVTKTTLFRSDSLDKKCVEDMPPIEVQIHQAPNNDYSSVSDTVQFNFELFKSITKGNPLSLSVQNRFPLKHTFKFNPEYPDKNEMNFWTHLDEDIDD